MQWKNGWAGSVLFAICLLPACSRNAENLPKMQTVEGPAGVIYIDDGGTGGVPVVFVHSFGGNTAHWSAQLAHLRTSRRAVALDLRGHGQSAPPMVDPYTVEGFAADIDAVVTALGFETFVLVGHSLGGTAAIAYANAHPDRVAGLVLVGAPGKMPVEQSAQIVQSIESDYEKVMGQFWDKLLVDAQPKVREQVRTGIGALPKAASIEIIRALFEYDPLPGLLHYNGPKLAVVTQHGDDAYALHKLMPDLPHTRIEGTSHWPHMDQPDEFNRILDDFLATTA